MVVPYRALVRAVLGLFDASGARDQLERAVGAAHDELIVLRLSRRGRVPEQAGAVAPEVEAGCVRRWV